MPLSQLPAVTPGGLILRKVAHLVYTDCLLESRTPCHTWAACKQQEAEQQNHGSGPAHVCMMRKGGKKCQEDFERRNGGSLLLPAR